MDTIAFMTPKVLINDLVKLQNERGVTLTTVYGCTKPDNKIICYTSNQIHKYAHQIVSKCFHGVFGAIVWIITVVGYL